MGVLNATPDSFSDAGDLRTLDDRLRRAEALLEAGADPTLANDEGKTPADLAGDATKDLVALSN
jgi:dihydropteroate synthase